MKYSKKKSHNTLPKGFKEYLMISSLNKKLFINRKRYEYEINGVCFKLPKKFHVVEFLKSLDKLNHINLDDIKESKDKDLIRKLKPCAEEIYNKLEFNYSTFTLFKNSINIIPLN